MRQLSASSASTATFRRGKSVAESPPPRPMQSSDDKSVRSDEHWFRDAARSLLSNKAGTALHYATGFEERSCQRYASGDVKPPAYFFRQLLRGDDGWTWLSAAMDGSQAPWWIEVQKARRIASALSDLS